MAGSEHKNMTQISQREETDYMNLLMKDFPKRKHFMYKMLKFVLPENLSFRGGRVDISNYCWLLSGSIVDCNESTLIACALRQPPSNNCGKIRDNFTMSCHLLLTVAAQNR